MRTVNRLLLNEITKNSRCIICNKQNPDPHHWKSKGSGGDDVEYNLMPLCRMHHTQCHTMGATTFSQKYQQVTNWLMKNGWYFDYDIGKWFHDNKK